MYENLYLNAMREIADLRGKVYDLEKDCLRLMSENKRFREALERIARRCEHCDHGNEHVNCTCWDEPFGNQIARKVLKEVP